MSTARDVAEALAGQKLQVLHHLLPGGKVRGHEYEAGNLAGAPGRSLKIHLNGKGCPWSDFATGEAGGDLLDLWAAARCHGDKAVAMREAAAWLGLERDGPPRKPKATKPRLQGRPAAPTPELEPSGIWTYTDAAGEPWIEVYRYDPPGRRKFFRQRDLRTGEMIGPDGAELPEPRPLYRLPDVLGRPGEPVVLVAGEKCAEALAELGFVATTNLGGEGSVGKADLAPLAGRTVTIWPDHDESGERWAEKLCDLLRAIGAAARRVAIPAGKTAGWDAADAIEEAWSADDVAAFLDAAEAVKSPLDLAALDLTGLASRHPPPRAFAWAPWIPARMVTLLHSYGGVGKTLLVQQIATAYALHLDLFGGATEGRPALVLFGEDDHDEVWRRQLAICRRFGIGLDDLAGKLDLLAVPHLDLTLATSTEVGAITPTPFLAELRQRIERTRPGFVGLDNSAKLFAVPEGNRIAVTRCIGLLNAICQDFDTTAVLVAHNNKDGQYSGTTAWENCCRSRLHMVTNDDGTVTMDMPKANYSAKGELILRWDEWSFCAEDPALMTMNERLEAEMLARQHAETFLRALDELSAQGTNVSDAKRAGNYAPKVIMERGLHDRLGKRQIEAAMLLLLKEGRIRANEPVGKGSNRHARLGLARSGA